jgi:hypothetical protein
LVASLDAGRWRLTEETSGAAELGYALKNGLLRARLEVDQNEYPVSSERERRNRRSAEIEGVLTFPSGPFDGELSVSLFRNDRSYRVNRLKDETRGGGRIEGALALTRGPWRLGGTLGLGLQNGDFRTYEGDERRNTNRAGLSGSFTFGPGHRVNAEGTVRIERFTYPEGIRRDDRDERKADLDLSVDLILDANTDLKVGFNAVQRDIAYLKAVRAINTSRSEDFTLVADISHESDIALVQRAEITALYTTFSHERDRNQIIRYLESTTRLSYPSRSARVHLTYLYRTQDRGSYVQDLGQWVYLRQVITYENTLSGTIVPLTPMGFALGLEGSWYSRHQRNRGEVDLVASETLAGLSLSKGSFLFAYRAHFRWNEDVFYSADVAFQTTF